MKVKVILQADVAGLGEIGDVKDVAGGYARNYLLPRKLVLPATKGNMAVLEQQRSRITQRQDQNRVEAQQLAVRIGALPLTFEVRVGEQGRLYGSVTGQDIAQRLKDDGGIEIDRRGIELKEPLRSLGEFDVPIRVAHTVTAHVKVSLRDQAVVRAEAAQALAAAQAQVRAEAEARAQAEAQAVTTDAPEGVEAVGTAETDVDALQGVAETDGGAPRGVEAVGAVETDAAPLETVEDAPPATGAESATTLPTE